MLVVIRSKATLVVYLHSMWLPERVTQTSSICCISKRPQRSTGLLCVAAQYGRETTVLRLLRLGAKQPDALDKNSTCPLKASVSLDENKVLRVLLDCGMDAVGNKEAIPAALGYALLNSRARFMDALPGHFDGDDDDTRRQFARQRSGGIPALHYTVSTGRFDKVSVLLAAGAVETATDGNGCCACGVIKWRGSIDPATKEALIRECSNGLQRLRLGPGCGELARGLP